MWIGVYDRAPGDAGGLVLRARLPVSVEADAAAAALPPAAVDPPPAFLLPNDGDLGYCKVRLDPRSWAALTAGLGHLADPLSRAVAWNAVRDLVRDAELPPRRYLELAVMHLPAETDTTIAGPVLDFARWTIADRYLPRPQRGAALAALAGLCRALLGQPAGEGADGLRLVAGRGLIDSASGPEVAALRSWLAAGRWPGGPDLDSRLRWQIMLRLTVLGAVGRPGIEREACRDTTFAGQQSAARCLAALPGLDAKRAAWTQMFSPAPAGEPSSYQLAATAEGFWQADQADLVARYVPRYFPPRRGYRAPRPGRRPAIGPARLPAPRRDGRHVPVGRGSPGQHRVPRLAAQAAGRPARRPPPRPAGPHGRRITARRPKPGRLVRTRCCLLRLRDRAVTAGR